MNIIQKGNKTVVLTGVYDFDSSAIASLCVLHRLCAVCLHNLPGISHSWLI